LSFSYSLYGCCFWSYCYCFVRMCFCCCYFINKIFFVWFYLLCSMTLFKFCCARLSEDFYGGGRIKVYFWDVTFFIEIFVQCLFVRKGQELTKFIPNPIYDKYTSLLVQKDKDWSVDSLFRIPRLYQDKSDIICGTR